MSVWLDDGEGGYFERNRVVAPPRSSVLPPAAYDPLAPEASDKPVPSATGIDLAETQPILNEVDPEAVRGHLAVDPTLLEHGQRGQRFFREGLGKSPQSVMAVPLRSVG